MVETVQAGKMTISAHLKDVAVAKVPQLTEERLSLIEQGQRDLYF